MEKPAPTTENTSGQIMYINKKTINKICSGQVIFDLATAVKELVENSLDSCATIVEIKLVDYGRTSITVADNGCGVLERDFDGLGLKHHTSKLKDFSDLEEVETFGFRGEALSSLCALSDLHIITKHSTALHAFDIHFDKNGKIKKKIVSARHQGTTVYIKEIFKNLPVRLKEFQKNIKKEFKKMIHVLHNYCLVSTGVKIICTNALGNKSSNIVFSTNGSVTVLDNISAIFGRKIRDNLLEVELLPSDGNILEEYSLAIDEPLNFRWKCFVSTCIHTLGCSSPDKQFFYVNNRPCDLSKVSKLINFIFHNYNNKQYPFVYLNILIEKNCADVNVTPDKRTVLLTNEKIIFAAIKSNFNKLWNSCQGVFTEKTLPELRSQSLKRDFPSSPEDGPPLKKLTFQRLNEITDVTKNISSSIAIEDIKTKLLKLKLRKEGKDSSSIELSNQQVQGRSNESKNKKNFISVIEKNKESLHEKILTHTIPKETFDNEAELCTKFPIVNMTVTLSSIKDKLRKIKEIRKSEIKAKNTLHFETRLNSNTIDIEREFKDKLTSESFDQMEIIGQFNLGFILAKLENNLFIVDQHASDEKYRFEKLLSDTKLKTQKLIVPKPLNLAVIKESVLMDNLNIFQDNGFTFEINNNEDIGRKVSLKGMPVSFNWQFSREDIEELIFLIQEGGEDGTNSNVIPRPSRIRQMLASRACRSAVMIGRTLNRMKMRQIVKQMGDMTNPWTCPHGRPTLRHLCTFTPFINSK
ncbi:mismatch repair endonuclease PMS2-like [Copidosoma floridanum]|uniref:mismatch repair endonuclease PMS2-like n=1 Tax=Copidosoma floridanum TaxID=29053 RepID=UPI0006C978AE|nr:mismatch repair endonuclease PMS2-like [Copidosoma floridanum]